MPASHTPSFDNPTASAGIAAVDETPGSDRTAIAAETAGFDYYKVEAAGTVGFGCCKGEEEADETVRFEYTDVEMS